MQVTYKNPGFAHSIDSILLFCSDSAAPYWTDALFYFYPQVKKEKMNRLAPDDRKAYLARELKILWDGLADELNRKVDAYNARFIRHHEQIEDALSEAFETDTRRILNDLVGNICLNPVCPRFLEERRFDVFYQNSECGALGMSLHEIIHFLWFHVWNKQFGDSFEEYEAPSLKWILSEMVVESIMSDQRLSSINPYYPREAGGCVYGYFQNMVVQGKPILDTLLNLYRNNSMTAYMAASYAYCLKHEAAIRRHIQEAEKAV